MSQCVAACLQYVAVCCSMFAVCRSVLQHVVDCVRCVCIVGECDTVCGILVVLRVLNSTEI